MSCLHIPFLVLAYRVEANTTLNEFSYIPITHETFSTKSNSSSSIYFPQLQSVYIYSKVPNSSPPPLINFRKFFGPPRSY